MIKKVSLTTLLFVLSWFIIKGQNFSKEFGKIGKDEIELEQYALDNEAEAVVLFDIGKSYFERKENSFNVIFERSTRIKILSESGVDWAEVEIPFYQEGNIYEIVYDIEAYSYNYENGHINKTPLNISNAFDEKINNYWNVKKLAIPNVKKGTIIEYRYKINSQYKFNLRDWEFQWKIPVVYSEYEVRTIPFYEYAFLLQGASQFDSQSSYASKGVSDQFGPITYQEMINKYIMKNLPAFSNEEFIASINDYIIKIDFQLAQINYTDGRKTEIITTWDRLITELLKDSDFGKYINKAEKISSKLISKEIGDLKTVKEKFNYILDYVKNNYNWNNNNGKYATKSPGKFIEEKNGSCADINLFTIGLLNAAGIDAYPVLISTRENGKIKFDYPFANAFNYVIILAEVEDEKILTDATESMNLNNRIPARCINDRGLIIKEDKVEWIGLECMFPSEIKTNIQIEIPDNENILTSISKTTTEYEALYYRNYDTDNIENIKNRIEAKGFNLIDSTINVQNQSDKEKPYILTYKQTGKPEVINEKFYISPFLNEVITDNPLKQKERTYPVDLTYPKQRTYNTSILIPDGYKVEYLPSEHKIKNHLFELTYSIANEDNKLNLKFDYFFKNPIYSPNDYSKIKFYFNEIIKKGNEKIVLSKEQLNSN